MIFTAPVPFAEAADHSAVKTLLPSALDSSEAQTHLDTEIRERARFSSQITNVEILDELDQWVDKLAQGQTDLATARNALRAKAKELGYTPEEGKAGTIQDFTTSRRLNVTLTTNVQQAQGYGQYMQGQDPTVLDLYPAQELYRAMARKVPRNWNARWSVAAQTTGTRTDGFVALKNTPIWTALSRFGTPYSPFDYNSGMRTRNVARSRAVAGGLIDRDTRLKPEDRGFNQDLAFSPEIRNAQIRQAIVEGSDGKLHFDADGTLRLSDKLAANEAAIKARYNPEDSTTWEFPDDEQASWERYLLALFNVAGMPLQAS